MRTSLFVPFLFLPLLAAAQQKVVQTAPPPPQGSNWQHVEALPVGASIVVKTRASNASCTLKTVDADTLTCTHKKDTVFQRTEILSIKIPRRGRSTLIAIGIGAGVGAGAAAAASSCNTARGDSCFFTRSESAAFGAALFGFIGAPIGYFTDFTRSTVYKAP